MNRFKRSPRHPPLCPPEKLNPYLLLAIAETESSFYPQAVGKVGERGLVQVRYGTFKMMMQEGDFYHWRDTLEAGANYLVYLLNRFKGNTILALAGYNAGPNRTRDRLLEIGRPYVRKVETNYTRIVGTMNTSVPSTDPSHHFRLGRNGGFHGIKPLSKSGFSSGGLTGLNPRSQRDRLAC